MIKITINKDKVEIDTTHDDGITTGCTAEELRLLKSIADEYCVNCKEGAE